MERTHSLARTLDILVLLALLCDLAALFLVPSMVRQKYVDLWLYQELLWDGSPVWQDPQAVVLMLFLWAPGICAAILLWQGRRVLRTVLRGHPFVAENAVSLRRAAVCAFTISGAALARLLWQIWYLRSGRPLFTYHALLVPLFAMVGLLGLVMSTLFRQAAALKAENDLTI